MPHITSSRPGIFAPNQDDALWRALEARLARTPLSKAPVLCVGFFGQDLQMLRKFSRVAGARLIAAASSVSQLDDHSFLYGYRYFFVNLDAFPDVESAVETLLAFRVHHPESIVLICSHKVSSDDFGTERAPIADATLKLPTSLERFTSALYAAATNAATRSRTNSQSHHSKWP